jgi:ribosome biogenesis GTPase
MTLKDLGWGPHFQAQLEEHELDLPLVRVNAIHRDAYEVLGPGIAQRIVTLPPDEGGDAVVAVGDWLVLDQNRTRTLRVLQRFSTFRRKKAGTGRGVQLIAANVNTLLIVTSANLDFNLARLERYLALAVESGVTPLVLITKADLVEDAGDFAREACRLMPGLVVEAIDARKPEALAVLAPWFGPGQTLALSGSSGVGKSTIVNTMLGTETQSTHDVREHDAHGRHTTRGRTMHRLPSGAWLIDTPGMRELQILDSSEGIDDIFADVVEIAGNCRFSDCTHATEPGCAVQAALALGTLDPERLKRYEKLQREDRRNSESLAAAHARNRKFGKMAKKVFAEKLKKRDW